MAARRMRVVDGVVLAAGALLALKAIAYVMPSQERGPDGLPTFARVLAHARSNPAPPDPETTGSVPAKDAKANPAPDTPASAAGPAPSPSRAPEEPEAARSSPSERAIRERMGERREELQRRSRELETREKLIEEAERRADAKAEEARLAEERAAAGKSPAVREGEALKGLVVMYETMKPKDAARVFDRLPEDVLVPVVRLIAPRKMAEIMAAMNSEAAQKLTVALARPSSAPVAEASAGAALPPGELPALEPPRRPAARAAN